MQPIWQLITDYKTQAHSFWRKANLICNRDLLKTQCIYNLLLASGLIGMSLYKVVIDKQLVSVSVVHASAI